MKRRAYMRRSALDAAIARAPIIPGVAMEYREIAALVGVSHSQIQRIVESAIRKAASRAPWMKRYLEDT